MEELENEKERKKLKKLEEQNKKTAEWRKKLRMKERKEAERKEKEELEKRIANSWAMINWVTEFINEHEEEWDLVRASQIEEANRELEEWNKLRRLDKIKLLQRKWNKSNIEKETTEKEVGVEQWNVWRKKAEVIENENTTTHNDDTADIEIFTPSEIVLPALKRPRIIPKFPVEGAVPTAEVVGHQVEETYVVHEQPANIDSITEQHIIKCLNIPPEQIVVPSSIEDPPGPPESIDASYERPPNILPNIHSPTTIPKNIQSKIKKNITTPTNQNRKVNTTNVKDNRSTRKLNTTVKDNLNRKTTVNTPILKHPKPEDNPTTKRRKKTVVMEDKNQKKITTMFKPRVNSTTNVYSDVKTQYKVGSNEHSTSTAGVSSSSTDVSNTGDAVPVQDCVVVSNIDSNPAGRPCPDYGKQKDDFTSREQLSESNFGPNDL